MRILVTGGAGFIGSDLIRKLMSDTEHAVLNLDKLTYAANLEALSGIEDNDRYSFVKADICDASAVRQAFDDFKPDAVMHLAAESHVDRSIDDASDFIKTNINGTCNMLDAALTYWGAHDKFDGFRFLHVSTDEVYGSLKDDDPAFTEETAYAPNSPYSASKASSDHMVRAYYHTHGLPTLMTHCSNNYGPWQNEEKLIPLMISHALSGKNLPIYGTGKNIRDWIYVTDHVDGLIDVLEKGEVGEVYNLGGENEVRNIDLVNQICDRLDALRPRDDGQSYKQQITYVQDRLGHDMRYAIDNAKIERTLGWRPKYDLEQGLLETIKWYMNKKESE